MKFLVISMLVASACAQFSNYNTRYSFDYPDYQRNEAPYAPSGWRPSGPSFRLPARQQLPKPDYGTPPQSYGTPSQEYGPPQDVATTTEIPEVTTTELPTTTEREVNQQDSEQLSTGQNEVNEENGKLSEENPGLTQQGVYYIYHPTGLLQRVIYTARDDAKNMAYTAQIRYQNVEPIRAPIYTYDPKTFAFQQIQL